MRLRTLTIGDAPLVSVILPVYNGENYVSQSLQSALSQTWRNLEVIVVNDGSTDRTRVVLEAAAASDPRIRIISQPNSGVARARNSGIAAARGTFIAPLDSDDLWEPRKIERQVRRMTEGNDHVGLVYCWWVWIDRQGAVLDRSPGWKVEGRAFELLLQVNFTGNASVPMYRRECLERVGGYDETFEEKDARGCEDWDVALRVAEHYDVAVVPEPLAGYRRSRGSMSSSRNTMWQSKELIAGTLRNRRSDLDEAVFRQSSDQFALYLAGTAFWAGEWLEALKWGLRARRSPFFWRVLPHVTRLLAKSLLAAGGRDKQVMLPGTPLDVRRLREPLIPYDRIYEDQARNLESPPLKARSASAAAQREIL